jgi:hypothetical protein
MGIQVKLRAMKQNPVNPAKSRKSCEAYFHAQGRKYHFKGFTELDMIPHDVSYSVF